MTNQTPVREYEKMLIRLPPGMRDALAAVAKANSRSVNAEVLAMLAQGIVDHKSPPKDAIEELGRRVEEMREMVRIIRENSPEIDEALKRKEQDDTSKL